MTPCKAFGHTEGRDKYRACLVCKRLRRQIRNYMWQWYYRLIEERPWAECTSGGSPEVHRAWQNMRKRRWRRKCSTARDMQLISQIEEELKSGEAA